MAPLSRIIKNITWLSTGNLIASLFSFLTTLILIKWLPVERFGEYKYAVHIVATFMFFQDFGIGMVLFRRLSRTSDDANANDNQTIASGIMLRTLLLLIVLIILIGYTLFIDSSPLRPFVQLLGISMVFEILFQTIAIILNAKERMAIPISLHAIKTAIPLLGVTLIGPSIDLTRVGVLILIARFLLFMVITFIFFRRHGIPHFGWKASATVDLLKNGVPFFMAGLFATLYTQLDGLMLFWISGPRELALYGAGTFLLTGIGFVPRSIATALFPTFSKDLANRSITHLSRGVSLALTMVLPLVAGGILLADDILMVFAKSDYLNAIPVFRITLPQIILSWVSILVVSYLNGAGHETTVTRGMGIGLLLNALLNALLIPFYGAIGAAIATVSAEIIFLSYFLHHLKSTGAPLCLRDLSAKPFLASVVMGAGLFSLNHITCLESLETLGFWIKFAVGGGLYFIVLLGLNGGHLLTMKQGQ